MTADWKERYSAINHVALRVAMNALYDTYCGPGHAGPLRGEAVQVVGRLAEELGLPGLIAEVESVPHGKRRSESSLWQGEGGDK